MCATVSGGSNRLRGLAGAFGQFTTADTAFIILASSRTQRRSRRGFLLTPSEVSALWHPLAETERAIVRVETSHFREVEPSLRLPAAFPHRPVTLLGRRDASLITVQRLLTDANYRKSVVAGVTNPAVQSFWLTEFDRWQERDRTQYLASLQNKLGAFTTNERLQAMLGATEKGIQLRPILDQSRILLCKLSKGTVGHDASTVLGSLLLSSLQVAAVSRANVPEDERPDAVVVIDEFHSYLAPGNTTMADALAESRKYRTSYVFSTQLL